MALAISGIQNTARAFSFRTVTHSKITFIIARCTPLLDKYYLQKPTIRGANELSVMPSG